MRVCGENRQQHRNWQAGAKEIPVGELGDVILQQSQLGDKNSSALSECIGKSQGGQGGDPAPRRMCQGALCREAPAGMEVTGSRGWRWQRGLQHRRSHATAGYPHPFSTWKAVNSDCATPEGLVIRADARSILG